MTNIPTADMLSTMHLTPQEYNNNSQGVNFIGTYLSPNVPLWASAINDMNIGPDIQLSTATFNAVGAIFMDISGNLGNQVSTTATNIIMRRTPDVGDQFFNNELVGMFNNVIKISTISSSITKIYEENMSLRTLGGALYDNLALSKLYVYAGNDVSYPPVATFDDNSAGGLDIIAPNGVTVNGLPIAQPPNIAVSSIVVNNWNPTQAVPGANLGNITLKYAPITGTSQPAGIIFNNTNNTNQSIGDPYIYMQGLSTMHNTNAGEKNLFFGGIPLNPVTQDYIPVAFTDINIVELSANPIKSASIYGQSGELIIETPQCHISSMLVSTINGVAPGSFVPPQDFICSTIGLRTLSANAAINCSTLTCSTINGVAPGTAILPPDVSFSTVTINETGDILLKGTTNNVTPSISSLTKARLLLDYSFPNNSNIKISVAALPNVNTTFRASFKNILTVSQLDTASNVEANFAPILCGGVGIGDFLSEYNDPAGYKYGTIKPYLNGGVSGMVINAPALVVTAPTQMTSLSLSTLSVSSIVDYNFTSAGAIQASAISSSTGAFLSANLSTFNFNASAGGVNLGGINLGMGGFLGGLVGELVSGALTTTIAGAALGTGIAGLILPYTYPPGTAYPPGANISSFQTVNGTTQLQFSTLGTSTNTYYRYTSSIAGSDPTLTPNPLTFVSSVISPGTVCIRSFSDPINPANPSTFRSTLQSFGQWVPVPGSGGGVLNPNIVASTITLGNSLLNSIVTPGGASIGGVQLGTTSGSVYGTVFQANTSIKSPVITVGTAFDTGISMSYSGTMSAKLLYVSTIACSNLANINSVLIGNSVGGIVATAVNSGTVSANTAIVGTTLNVTGAAVANISTLNTNVETASQIFTSSILVTGNYTQGGVGTFSVAGAGGTVSIPNGTLSLVPTAPGGLTLNTTGLINTQSLAVVGSANVASNVTIGNTLTVGKIALVSSINTGVCAITGGSIYTPQFNSSPNPQQTIAPFNIASGSYTVPGLQINNAVSLRVIAAQSYTDNTNIIIAEPMSGIWDVYTTWYYSTGTGKVLRCYIVPISVHNITLAVVTNNTTNLTFNMTNTGQSITSLCVSWYAAPWCDFS